MRSIQGEKIIKTLIGHISVDAGICWIGDPCYILHKNKDSKYDSDKPPLSVGSDWGEFCDKLEFGYTQFKHNNNINGLGVCVSTGYGDGYYPVYANIEDGRIHKVWVDFVGDENE